MSRASAVEDRPDIAFVDIGLPRLVALSGYGSFEHRARALEAGFDAHIAKPIDVVHLRREIAALSGPCSRPIKGPRGQDAR